MLADMKNRSQNGLVKKYILIGFISVFTLLLCGQLIAQFYSVRQLDKVIGKVVSTDIRRAPYAGGRKSSRSPNYTLFVTLDNGKVYNIKTNDTVRRIDSAITPGKLVTIYNPTTLYNLFSLDILDRGSRVSQVEANNQVWYSFDSQQRKNRPAIFFFVLAIGAFGVFLYAYYKNR
jgi:hypothetical protein